MRTPVADWGHINHYFDAPADFDRSAPGEMWSQAELDADGDWLSDEQVQWALSVQSYEEEDEDLSPPAGASEVDIAAVKHTWIEEATKLKLINGPHDTEGLQELKKVLGATYTNLVPGCSAEDLKTQGLNIIRNRRGRERAA